MDFEPHSLANIFPMLEKKEFDALCEDIKTNGVHEPVIIFEDKVLDGRNRYKACKRVGVEPSYELFQGDRDGALDFVISLNLTRRHLNEAQRAAVADKIATMPAGGAGYRSQANLHAGLVSRAAAAEKLNIGTRSVAYAHSVHAHGIPELQRAMDQGLIAVSSAAAIAKLDAVDQAKFSAVISGEKGYAQVRKEIDAGFIRAAKKENIAEGERQREIDFQAFLHRLLDALAPNEEAWIARFRRESPGPISDGLAKLFYGDLYLFCGEEG
jgi:ParB-like chromosome segregation protein Spo0J